jgi:hypothetical protein
MNQDSMQCAPKYATIYIFLQLYEMSLDDQRKFIIRLFKEYAFAIKSALYRVHENMQKPKVV